MEQHNLSLLIWHVELLDIVTLGTGACKCDVPCIQHQYDAVLSSSLLDSYKIRDEIKSHEKSRELLPRYQEAVDISAQVNIFLINIVQSFPNDIIVIL